MTDAQIFQLLGIVYFVIGIGIVINRDYYLRMFDGFIENSAVMYLGGCMSLIVGFLLVTFHNEWTASWSVIITIIGWLALIKGFCLFLVPKLFIRMIRAMKEKPKLITYHTLFVIVLGFLCMVLGFLVL